ncbi:hypothetical protein KBX50_27905 [Micromonospora sp. C51]|uniref:hypothetical protein n=1 Tax=Micromonospora sp. C51 TaxID=2824879 RepID=UPI001B36EE7B|nr:hypothetical protein [Micromonospora sp. C51]MBQ1052266.1 hypothetical protein [Micromonospora sp. C51]
MLGYLAARLLPAALGLLTTGLLVVGAVLAAIVLRSFVAGTMTAAGFLLQGLIGAALLLVNLQAIASVATLDRWLARRLLEANRLKGTPTPPSPNAYTSHRARSRNTSNHLRQA